jgi:hypothetical protein
MNFKDFKDIKDFYAKTGMTREEAFIYLKRQLELQLQEEKPD